jgi:hypothetical protein
LIRNFAANQWTIGAQWNNCALPVSSNGGNVVWSNATAAFADGNYHQLTITRDSLAGTVAFYLDGESIGGGVSGTGYCFGGAYSLGKIERGTLEHPVIPGNLCDVRIYDQALNASEVATLYSSSRGLCQSY